MIQAIERDPDLFYWILIPITIVMILTGILRFYASALLTSKAKTLAAPSLREQAYLRLGSTLRTNGHSLALPAFLQRRQYLVASYQEGRFMKNRAGDQSTPANPLTDPAAMDGMMGMMKGNMMMMIPQTLVMTWINAFFSGFVIMKLPFPLTPRFKSMLQAGIATQDLDVQWVSSLSWYFLNLFGLQSLFIFIIGHDNAAQQLGSQMGMMNTQGPQLPPGQDVGKAFSQESENLEVMDHWFVMDHVAHRVCSKW